MKALMRLDKRQVPSDFTFASGTGVFKRDLYLAAGYKTIDVLLIGAMGGYAGDSAYNSTYAHTTAGGGGGGLLKLRRPLTDLPAIANWGVGVKGGPQGVRGADGGYSGPGIDGGDSFFGDWTAMGGLGAGPCMFAISGKALGSNSPSLGGDGGGNSLGYGTVGLGGQAEYYSGVGNTIHHNPVNATNGTYVDMGNGNGGGGGGGGGKGMFRWNSTSNPAGSGGDGNSGNAQTLSVKGANIGYYGGDGGGGNAKVMLGTDAIYGTDAGGGNPNGIVIVKLS